MNFFNIGPGELLFILVFALIIFGPGKLPEVAKGLGKAISDFRRASQGLTDGLTRELNSLPTDRESPVQSASGGETPGAVSASATAPTPGVAQPTVPLQTASADAGVSAQASPAGSPQDAAAPQARTKDAEAAVETWSATA